MVARTARARLPHHDLNQNQNQNQNMKALARTFLLAAFVALVGCDYKVPLVETPELPLDKNVIGLWERTRGPGEQEKLLVLPLGPKEYLVAFTGTDASTIYARGCLGRAAGRTFVQLNWFGTSDGSLPGDDKRVYQFATYSVPGETLRFRLLNPDVVDREAASTAALIQAIEGARNKPDLFQEEQVFQKARK